MILFQSMTPLEYFLSSNGIYLVRGFNSLRVVNFGTPFWKKHVGDASCGALAPTLKLFTLVQNTINDFIFLQWTF
jgi:hypothetical protein